MPGFGLKRAKIKSSDKAVAISTAASLKKITLISGIAVFLLE